MDQNFLFFLLLAVGLLTVLFVHELGHLLVARYYGIKVRSLSVGFGPSLLGFTDKVGTSWKLRLLPLGGSCILDDRLVCKKIKRNGRIELKPASLLQRALIYAAGPVLNLIFSASLSLVAWIFCLNSSEMAMIAVRLVAQLSFAIALFNLLPILPLDGGRLCLAAIESGLGRSISQTHTKYLFLVSTMLLMGATLTYLIHTLSGLLRHGLTS